jgi:hypothetical protein
MGCDFYTYIYLEIKHTNGVSYIELNKLNEYYCDCLEPIKDSDDEDDSYCKKVNEYLDSFLKPVLSPIVIYENKKFVKDKYRIKYQELLEYKTTWSKYWRDTHVLLNFNDIIKVTKIEIREKAT